MHNNDQEPTFVGSLAIGVVLVIAALSVLAILLDPMLR